MKRYAMSVVCLTCMAVSSCRAGNIFDSFDKAWEEMQDDMLASMKRSRNMFKEMSKLGTVTQEESGIGEIQVTEDKNAGTVTVAIPANHLCRDGVKIEVEDETARVKIPVKDGQIQVVVEERHVVVSGAMQLEKKTKKDDQEVMAQSVSQFHMEQLLPVRVDVNSVKAHCKGDRLFLTFAKKNTKRVITIQNEVQEKEDASVEKSKKDAALIAEDLK